MVAIRAGPGTSATARHVCPSVREVLRTGVVEGMRLLATAAAVAALAANGSGVARAGAAPASSRPLALPAPGRLLVEAPPFGLAIVEQDGRVRRLGEWYEAAWSPDGGLVAAAGGRRLAVLDLSGSVSWSLRRSRASTLAQPDWAPDGRRLAYRSGAMLRVVGARGGADRAVARGLGFAGPRWRPGEGRLLAWADRRGHVRVLDVVSRRTLWRSPPGPPVRPAGLQWSPTGATLAAVSGSAVRVFDAGDGRLLRRLRSRGTDRFQFGAFTRGEPSLLALVRHDFTRGTSRVTLVSARTPAAREREVFARHGLVVDVTSAPDGRWLLLGWRGGDEWRFVPLADDARAVAIKGVTRRLNRQASGRWAFPAVRGWCCPRRV
jgi:hypothetical protein